VTSTLTLTASRWRLLNALAAVKKPVGAAGLLAEQDAPAGDLHWLAEADLTAARVPGLEVRLDLAEHLAQGGTPAAVAVKLNTRGRRALQAPQNRVLRQLAGIPGAYVLAVLLEHTGVDRDVVAGLCRRALLSAAVRSSGEPLTADDLVLLPAETVTVQLTAKGRDHLPRGGQSTTPLEATVTAPASVPAPRRGGFDPDQPRDPEGKWVKVTDVLGYADDERCLATDAVAAAGPVPSTLSLVDFSADGSPVPFVAVATPASGAWNPVTGMEEPGAGNAYPSRGGYMPPHLSPREAERAAKHLEELADLAESDYRPPKPTKASRALQRLQHLIDVDQAALSDPIGVGDDEKFPLTVGDLINLLGENGGLAAAAAPTRHKVIAKQMGDEGGEQGTLWMELRTDAAGGRSIAVTGVEGDESPEEYDDYTAVHSPTQARELAAKLRAFARAAARR
jgi:hypothetical protein